MNEIGVDTDKVDLHAIDIIAADVIKYSQFCEIFVPKSQKVTAELSAKQPKNLNGRLQYNDCFDNLTRELYCAAWEHILLSANAENEMKDAIMMDIDFELNEAFRQLTQGREISRNDLLEALNGICD